MVASDESMSSPMLLQAMETAHLHLSVRTNGIVFLVVFDIITIRLASFSAASSSDLLPALSSCV